jgi:hypothetical protein
VDSTGPLRFSAAVLVLFALAAAPALLAAADYGPSVTDGTSSNAERKAAVAPDGTVFATFTEPQGNSTAIAVKRSTDGGKSWILLPLPSTAAAFRSCVAVDSHGTLHIAWTEFVGPDRQVFYARLDGQLNWTGKLQLSDTLGYSGFPSLAVDSQDRVHVVWYGFDGATYQVYYRYLDASGWHPAVQATHGVQDANNPSIAMGPDDRVHVAFFSYFRGQTDVWYMVGGPSGWNILQRVNPTGVPSSNPSIVVHANGTAAIAYASGENATLEVRYTERDASGNWSVNEPVSALGEGGSNPSLVASDHNEAAVFFETASGELKYSVRSARNALAWSAERPIYSPAKSHWLSASWAAFPPLPETGDVSVLWTQDNGTGFEVGFATVNAFAAIAPGLPMASPWWQGLVLPLALVSLSGISMAAFWVSSMRTKGGGRG